ncbi:hypothetical protein PTKIN_Ptkin14bG0058200 [Pterospermum kingtungense]
MVHYMDLKLLKAARSGNLEEILKLAKDVERRIYDQTTPEGNTVLHMAARFGHKDLVNAIVKKYPSLILKSNLKGETPVHIAARAGKREVVECFIDLVENFSEIARIGDKYGNTPLHGAVRNKNGKVVKALAEADKESLLLINVAGESPLSIAIDMRYPEIAKSIIAWNPSTIEFTGHNGQTSLHYAVIRNDPNSMTAILQSKKNLVSVQDKKKRTPLHYAAALGNHEMVQELLEENPSVAYTTDYNHQTPVHLAAENGQKCLIKTLIEYCPDTIEIVDKKQRNVLHLAAMAGNLDVVLHILDLPEIEDLINSPDADGNTPLHLATQNYHGGVAHVLSKNPKVEIRAINNKKKTALAIAKSPDDRGMELQKYLTLKALKRAYNQRSINPEGILENTQLDDVEEAKDREKKGNDGSEKGHEKEGKDDSKKGREMAGVISVMSTLIATFTFTAAFTIPGGFEDEGEYAGTVILIRKAAFQAFVISDTISMTSSITSAVLVFWAMSRRDAESFMDTLPFAIGLTWISLIAMELAFVTGLFVVLQKKLWLAILVCVFGSAAPFFLYIFAPTFLLIYERVSKSQPSFIDRHNIVDDNPFYFFVRLISIYVGTPIQKLWDYKSFCKKSCCFRRFCFTHK